MLKIRTTFVLIGLLSAAAHPSAQAQTQAPEKSKPAAKAKATAKAKVANPAFAPVVDVPGLPRVLILGDSISIGYTVDAREALEGVANVHRPAENCGPSSRGVESIDKWLDDGHWDVIHFNHGLHDLRYLDEQGQSSTPESGKLQVPLDQYRKNLEAIVARLKKTGATLIFATTTPVPPGEPQRKEGEEKAYNDVAREVMKEQGVAVDDLYAFIAPKFAEVAVRPGNVHFNDEGYKLLGKRAAEAIREALKAKK